MKSQNIDQYIDTCNLFDIRFHTLTQASCSRIISHLMLNLMPLLFPSFVLYDKHTAFMILRNNVFWVEVTIIYPPWRLFAKCYLCCAHQSSHMINLCCHPLDNYLFQCGGELGASRWGYTLSASSVPLLSPTSVLYHKRTVVIPSRCDFCVEVNHYTAVKLYAQHFLFL